MRQLFASEICPWQNASGKIYAVGGYGSGLLESVEAYDPQLGSWALVASMSVKYQSTVSAVLDGKIYIIGGIRSKPSGIVDMVWVYSPQADTWQQVASIPQGLCGHAVTAMGGKIYMTGGYNGGMFSSVYVYDPQADAWIQLASMGNARYNHASAAVDGKLYVFGGKIERYGNEKVLDTVEVYDPVSDSWAHGPSLTSSRHDMVAVAL